MEMRWRWKLRWQLLNRDTRRGTQKRRGKRENTNTNTPSTERANPERAREKEKRTDDGPNTDQRRGGGQKRLTQPTRREAKPTSAREEFKLDLEREHATHEIGDQWGTSWWKLMHPQTHAKFRDGAQGPRSSSDKPLDGLSGQASN